MPDSATPKILDRLTASSIPMNAEQLVAGTGFSHTTILKSLRSLVRDGQVIDYGSNGHGKIWGVVGQHDQPNKAAPNTIDIMSSKMATEDLPWLQPLARSGASNHEAYPSRMGRKLIYRDGRTEEMQ